MDDVELRLWDDLREAPSLKDPGLHPDFSFFHSARTLHYLRWARGMLNALISAYAMEYDSSLQETGDPDDWKGTQGRIYQSVHARTVFLDSGAITPLVRCVVGKGNGDEVRAWMTRQVDIVKMAHRLHALGCGHGTVGVLDLPQYPAMLDAAGIGKDEATRMTFENAAVLMESDMPEGWWPTFTVQGITAADYVGCVEHFASFGAIDLAQAGKAWIAVGGTRDVKPPALFTIYRSVREAVGPDVHIHALGISRIGDLVHMARRGWVNGADSASAAIAIAYNRGPYHVDGPRLSFVQDALLAAQALLMDGELAQALERAKGDPLYEQEALL